MACDVDTATAKKSLTALSCVFGTRAGRGNKPLAARNIADTAIVVHFVGQRVQDRVGHGLRQLGPGRLGAVRRRRGHAGFLHGRLL